MKLTVGDKLYCKVEMRRGIGNYLSTPWTIITVGKQYEIVKITDNSSLRRSNNYYVYIITDENSEIAIRLKDIWDYFYSLKEYRKLKMKEINEKG